MGTIRTGCQTYTWEMLGDRWQGTVDDILDAVSGAGYEGIEITNTMIGPYYDRPGDFARALERRGLAFCSFGMVPRHGFTEADRGQEELENARRGIGFVSRFPGTRLDLAGGSTGDRVDVEGKFETMCGLYNRIAREARDRGVDVDVHPHSHAGSIIESAEEYDRLMSLTDPGLVGWCPDTGHIVRGGLDLLATLKKYGNRIRNIHFKDVDRADRWRMMGSGVCDFAQVLGFLESIGYRGWVVAEEESKEARRDQAGAVKKNRVYLQSLGY
jgi:sugar phosphate isomerase/epimerase